MKIDRTLKIKEKYFNAILKLEKPFELRHFYLAPNSIVKLDCIDSNNIDTGRYLIFKSGKCYEIQKGDSGIAHSNGEKVLHYEYYISINLKIKADFSKWVEKEKIIYCTKYYVDGFYGQQATRFSCKWFDNFCWEYITKEPTYLIEIAEILEVK